MVAFLIIAPFWLAARYFLLNLKPETSTDQWQNISLVQEQTRQIANHLPVAQDKPVNQIIIPKIGVNAPIIESLNESYGLARGAWRLPQSSTPDEGGNTVITGHRFQYLPPNNVTFYLLDKLEIGDIISIIWQQKEYYYKVIATKIIKPEDLSILASSEKNILTVFTCNPVFSMKERLVVIAELIEETRADAEKID